ncbi:C40 family peptidase [Patescibacteria group bacterium]|nr:C40 family peptidase [Patescibacteria group bacterium]
MKKLIFILFLFSLFLPSHVIAKTTTLINCSTATKTTNQASDTCFVNGGKVEADYQNCGVDWLGENEVCCCQEKIDYNCSWRTEISTLTQGSVTVGGCLSTEHTSTYTDCDPNTKPANSVQLYSSQRTYCCCPGSTTVEKAKFTMPEPEILDINTLKLSTATCTEPDNAGTCSIPWIAQLIQYLYTFGLGIGGILAAVVLMAGGLIWLVSAGDVTKITQAKSLIVGSITGLMILFGSYILLTQINPNLVVLKPLSLKMIEQKLITPDKEAATPISLDMEGIAQITGVKCGTDTIADIIKKSKGKVTYNNPNRGSTGPNDTVYNDCSGFANFVLKCGLNKDAASYTGDIFSEQTSWDGNVASLQVGDLIGWAPTNSDQGNGHVFIYMGNGVFGDCHGGTSGRKTGNCVSTDINVNTIKNSAQSYSNGKLFIKRY